MSLDIALYPTQEQIERLISEADDNPVQMLNLLKFRAKAKYEDGRETDLTGQEAYGLYAAEMQKIVQSDGGKFTYTAAVRNVMIGVGDLDFDVAAIVEYPSGKAFAETTSKPEVRAIAHHRAAGLEGQLLIALKPVGSLTGK